MKKYLSKNTIYIMIAGLIFLILSLTGLNYVGTHDDECMVAQFAYSFLYKPHAHLKSDVVFELFGKQFPTNMDMPYAFMLPSYLYLPFAVLAGLSVYSLKLFGVFMSLLFVIYVYKVLKLMFGRNIAFISTLLLCINFHFVHYARFASLATEPYNNMIFFAGLFYLLKYSRTYKAAYLYAFFFITGLGLSVKISYVSRILGLAVAAFLVYPTKIHSELKKREPAKFLKAFLFFLIGSSLFMLYNVKTGGETFRLIKYMYPHGGMRTYANIDNWALKNNSRLRVNQLKLLLAEKLTESYSSFTADSFTEEINASVSNQKRGILLRIYIFIFLALPLLSWLASGMTALKKTVFIYIMYLLMFFTSLFTPGTLRTFHFIMLFPFFQLIIASFIVYSYRILKRILVSRRASIVSSALLSLLVIIPYTYVNAAMHVAYLKKQITTGGTGIWSGYLDDLVDYCRESGIRSIGPLTVVLTLPGKIESQGEVRFTDWFIGSHDKEPVFHNLEDMARLKTAHIVEVVSDEFPKQKKRLFWIREYRKYDRNFSVELVHSIKNKQGKDIYRIYKLSWNSKL